MYFEPITDLQLSAILEIYERTPKSVLQDIEVIKSWFKTQEHISNVLSDEQILRHLVMNKCSVEKTKLKLEMYYSIRSIVPCLFENTHPLSDRMIEASKYFYVLLLPKLNPDYSKTCIIKPKPVDFSNADIHAIFSLLLNGAELRLLEDLSAGTRTIIDLEHCNASMLTKFTLTTGKKFNTVLEKAYTSSAKSVHFLNCPGFIDKIFLMAKAVVKPKIYQRYVVHKNYESLHKVISKEVLPREYGGYEKSLDELEAMIYKRFNVHSDYFTKRNSVQINEKLRPEKNVNHDLLGFHGNFKKLEVD